MRMDRTGKVLHSVTVGRCSTIGSHMDALPNGHVLVPIYTTNRVVELDAEGKEVWSAQVVRPTSVQRLPNGRVLVGSQATMTIVEIDREGHTVSSQKIEGWPMRVSRR
jgi:hypothetical protein